MVGGVESLDWGEIAAGAGLVDGDDPGCNELDLPVHAVVFALLQRLDIAEIEFDAPLPRETLEQWCHGAVDRLFDEPQLGNDGVPPQVTLEGLDVGQRGVLQLAEEHLGHPERTGHLLHRPPRA